MESKLNIATLAIYPIKSLRGINLPYAAITERGLQFGEISDRTLMLVQDGRFITQRRYPQLAALQVRLLKSGGENGVHDLIEISDGKRAPLIVNSRHAGNHVKAGIWEGDVDARSMPQACDDWFSEFLRKPTYLVAQTISERRYCNVDFAHRPGEDHVSFADGFPILVTNLATLRTLNQDLPTPIPMNRFRPNIVVQSETPEAEYSWRRLSFGSSQSQIELVKPCTRCPMPSIDQETGARTGPEPLKTLMETSYMSFEQGSSKVDGGIFGMNAVPVTTGTISVNDPITVQSEQSIFKFARRPVRGATPTP